MRPRIFTKALRSRRAPLGGCNGGLKFISPIRELSDAEAERCRHHGDPATRGRPREEAAYKRALQSGRHTIESLVGGSASRRPISAHASETLRTDRRLAGMPDTRRRFRWARLRDRQIPIPPTSSREVYDDHFAEGQHTVHEDRGSRILALREKLYERYKPADWLLPIRRSAFSASATPARPGVYSG